MEGVGEVHDHKVVAVVAVQRIHDLLNIDALYEANSCLAHPPAPFALSVIESRSAGCRPAHTSGGSCSVRRGSHGAILKTFGTCRKRVSFEPFPTYFLELRKAEVQLRRTPLSRIWVNNVGCSAEGSERRRARVQRRAGQAVYPDSPAPDLLVCPCK